MSKRLIHVLLLSLVLFDVFLAVTGFFFGEYWFALFHGAPYVDPQAYLPRAAGNWAMFAVLQLIALTQWERRPVWLAMIAAVRWSDGLTDWSVAAFSESISPTGMISFGLAGAGNFVIGAFLWSAWKRYRHQPA